MQVSIIRGLKGAAKEAKKVNIATLVSEIVAKFKFISIYEWLHADDYAKPYFDVDGKVSETTADDLLVAALAGVDTFFGFKPTRVVVTEAHGGDKLSFHIFVPGYRMKIADIKKRLVRLGLDKNRPFDTAVYGSNQKFRMVGSYKTETDQRPLIFRGGIEPTHDAVRDTIVQHVEDDWPLLQEADPQPSAAQPPLKPTPKPASKPPQSAASTAASGSDPPAPKRARGRPPKHLSIPADHAVVLKEMGFRHPQFTGSRDEGYNFTADNRDACPSCTADHDSNQWWFMEKPDAYLVANYSARCKTRRVPKVIEAIVPAHADFATSVAALGIAEEGEQALTRAVHYHQAVVTIACDSPDCMACDQRHESRLYDCTQVMPHHCWSVKNRDMNCPGRIFHHSPQLYTILTNVIIEDVTISKLARLFVSGHCGHLHIDHRNDTLSEWKIDHNGVGKWSPMKAREFQAKVSWWFTTLFSSIKRLPDFTEHLPGVKRAMARADSQIRNILNDIRGTLEAENKGKVMDANPYLLGTDNGVIDLKTCTLRPATPEDLVTKSVGYSIPDGTFDSSAVEELFTQIYPMEPERRFFQTWGGYCLLGNHLAKGMVCLNDRRAGNNGKSTTTRILKATLGPDYTIGNKDNLLYESRYVGDVNSHDSGMLAFEGKRLAIMEELKSTRTLDTDLLKRITGGETTCCVRSAGSGENREMHWSAKLVTVFNEGCMPKFKTEDAAFANRLLVIPHRSLFCDHPENSSAPYTYLADGSKELALRETRRHELLTWFLEGLKNYWQAGTTEFVVPPTCRQWGNDLLRSQDPLMEWASERIFETTGNDFITLDALHQLVRLELPELSVGPRVLKAKILKMWPATVFKKHHTVDGIRHSGVFMRLALST